MINEKRVLKQNNFEYKSGAVVYWMQREQRAFDNWALIFARQLALENHVPLYIVFNLVPDFLDATIRQYGFMLKGLKETETNLAENNIPLYLLEGDPGENIPEFVKEVNAGVLVSDFNPLKIARLWKKKVIEKIKIPYYTVDAHNIVPAWVVSQKTEFAAYTIRPKINKLLPEFLDDFPDDINIPKYNLDFPEFDLDDVTSRLRVNFNITECDLFKSGSKAGEINLKNFIHTKLNDYNEKRNDPNESAISGMSPYYHFGQVAPQRAALEVKKSGKYDKSVEAYLEELIVRRELSDNFCFCNKNYDTFDGFHDWARATLNEHREDEREYLYSLEEFENSNTHDPLWNAAQSEVVKTGKMHGYMRMYWAKKILEWTKSPEEALKIAIYLNDKYQLDGRDPNGYVGVAWSIGGVHDRAWTERPVYGKIRYMNFNGAKRKFDVPGYIDKIARI